MYCKYCGKEIKDDSKFCRWCGKSLYQAECHETSTCEKDLYVTESESNFVLKSDNGSHGSNRLLNLFLYAIFICIICTGGYALFRYNDSLPYDEEHYWGYSVFDPNIMSGGSIEDVYEDISWIRKNEYHKGIERMAIYSFPISLGVLVLGAIFTGKMTKK